MKKTLCAASLLFVAILFLTVSCAYQRTDTQLHERLNLSWDPGDSWTVGIEYWPDRLEDPYTESSRKRRVFWKYQVLESEGDADNFRVLVNNVRSTYLLQFNNYYTLLTVQEVLEKIEGNWKTRTVRSSPTGGRAFLVRNWRPDTAAFWLHPDLSETLNVVRYNFTRGGRVTGRWMNQTVEPYEDGIKITLEHKPTQVRAVFYWRKGEPWWEKALYFRRQRLVMRAQQQIP